MRPRVALRVTVLLLALILLPLAAVRALHNPTVQSIRDVAELAYQMGCEPTGAEVLCDAGDFDGTWHNHATIKPASGNLTSLYTVASVTWVPLGQAGSYWEGWLRDMHTAACGGSRLAAGEVATLVAEVAALTKPGSGSLTIAGECDLTGGMSQAVGARYYDYWINAVVIVPPPPTPVPTPVPTPTPTPPPVVTPPPTATPSPAPSATPRPSTSATGSATPTSSPTPTPTTTPTPAASPSRTPRPSASATPEQTVAGITFAPEPSAAVPDVAEDSIPWTASVHGPADVSTEPAALGASAAMAMLLLLFMGFVGELFNNTVKANYDELLGWWQKSWPGRMTAAWARLWRPRP